VDHENIRVHAIPRTQAPAWLMQKHAEGYELDLKLWGGLWMLAHALDGSALG
jgi:ADP-ribose pyrophosphatase